jgi:hypothetical protein
MKLSLPLFTLTCILQSSNAINNSTRNLKSKSWEYSKSKGNLKSKKSGKSSKSKGPSGTITVPEIGSLIDKAFPMWEVDEDGNRVEDKPCNIDSCEWNPFYITKRYDGLDPKFGGHPTDLDVNYAFFGPSPFGGQPYPGTPHHCKLEAGDDIKAGDCPKLETLTDKGPFGPGHVPPHIALAALTWLVVKTCHHKHIFGMNLHILQNI